MFADLRLWALAASLLTSAVLVFILRYDTRFDKTVDLDYYRAYPTLNKSVSTIKETVKTFVPALFLGYLLFVLWAALAPRMHWPQLPALPAHRLGPLGAPAGHPFWAVVAACALAIAALKALRCRGAPRERYDVFISYKSENVLLARQVAEQLIAAGVKAWFAEYELLLGAQIRLLGAPPEERREMIAAALREGIAGSASGLAFTNDRYAGSVYCREEMQQLLEGCGPERVFEVMVPPERETHRAFPSLAQSPALVSDGSVDRVLAFLAGHTGWPLSPRGAKGAPLQRYRGTCLGRAYTLDITGWALIDQGGGAAGPGTSKGPELRREVPGGRLYMNLFFGPELDPTARRTRLGGSVDDRDMYNQLLVHARKHQATLHARPRGAHLIFHGGFSQLGLTYRLMGIWIRKYSIILAHPSSGELAEFVFTFSAAGLPFKEFCRHAYLMDEVVTSLEWS